MTDKCREQCKGREKAKSIKARKHREELGAGRKSKPARKAFTGTS